MEPFLPPSSMPQADVEAWRRILAKRQNDCQHLREEELTKILEEPLFKRDPVDAPKASMKPHEKIYWLLRDMLRGSTNDKKDPESRRSEYINLKMLLKSIDTATANSDRLNKENGTKFPYSSSETNRKNQGSNNSTLRESDTGPKTRQTGYNTNEPEKTLNIERAPIIDQQVLLKTSSSASNMTGKNFQDQSIVSSSRDASLETFQPPQNRNQSRPVHRGKVNNAQKDRAPLKSPQVVLTEAEIKRPLPFIVPRINIGLQPQRIQTKEIWFPQDIKRYSGALRKIERSLLTWRDCVLPEKDIESAIGRFHKWDPYWEMLEILTLTQTAKVDKAQMNSGDNIPQQAVSVNLAIPPTYQRLIENWGKHVTGSYISGTVRLLLRMIPYKIPKKKSSKKKLRGDYHLWPKGTLLCVDDLLADITQRKQQSHDLSEWKGACKTLDLVQCIRKVGNNRVKALTLDSESYFLCIAVCKYRSHEQLYVELMRDSIKKLSKELSIQLAIIYAKKNKTVCLDGEATKSNDDKAYFITKLTCTLSCTMMKTPVRAAQCNHFQCFDLGNFLYTNHLVTGTRWECPVCNNELISVYDLQYCGLTAHMLEQYKSEAGTSRDSVQFFSDGTWNLMGEKRKRYASKESSIKDSKKTKMAQEVISID